MLMPGKPINQITPSLIESCFTEGRKSVPEVTPLLIRRLRSPLDFFFFFWSNVPLQAFLIQMHE